MLHKHKIVCIECNIFYTENEVVFRRTKYFNSLKESIQYISTLMSEHYGKVRPRHVVGIKHYKRIFWLFWVLQREEWLNWMDGKYLNPRLIEVEDR